MVKNIDLPVPDLQSNDLNIDTNNSDFFWQCYVEPYNNVE